MNNKLKKGEQLSVIFPGGSCEKNEVIVKKFSQDKKWVHLKLKTGGETWREIKDVEAFA